MGKRRPPAEIGIYLRMMAAQQRQLAVEFDQQAQRLGAAPTEHEPDRGHTWRIRVEERSSSKVTGDPHHHDAPEFTAFPQAVEVRAWSLNAAFAEAAALPLTVWFPEEED